MPRSAAPRSLTRIVRYAIALASGTFITLASIQCRPRSDAVTGVDTHVHAGSARPPLCLHGCIERFRRAYRDESRRHHRALRACHGDRACRSLEHTTHRERSAALAAGLKDCRTGCYGEGAGAGGR